MGQRANLIIVSGESCEIHYTHHRANTLDRDLFWGPEYSLGFIRSQRSVNRNELLDEIWAEGGAVMDTGQNTLLWYGSEDIQADVPLRRMHGTLMSALWPGWRITWASGGMVDLAQYIQIDTSVVLRKENEPVANQFDPFKLIQPVPEPYWSTLASIRLAGGNYGFCRLRSKIETILFAGEKIVEAMMQVELPSEFDLTGRVPRAGFHIDPGSKNVDFWIAGWSEDVHRRVQSQWPNWNVIWHRDRFECQLEKTAGCLRFPIRGKDDLINELRTGLLRSETRLSGAESAAKTAKALAGLAGVSSIEINPAALHDAQLILPLDLRTRLFDSAVASLHE
jgi:hypothetical protein